jgi:hypothetical protein
MSDLLQVSRQETNFQVKLYLPAHILLQPDYESDTADRKRFFGRTKAIDILRYAVHECFTRWIDLQNRHTKSMFYRLFHVIKSFTNQYDQMVTLKTEIHNMELAIIPSGKYPFLFLAFIFKCVLDLLK